MQRPVLSTVLLALALLASPGVAAPQDPTPPRPPSTPDTLDRSRPAQTLDSVRVLGKRRGDYGVASTATATKTDTPLRDVPQAITVVTRELMQDLSMQGMADVTRFLPGVTMGQGEGNRDQATIRGNNTTADFFVDGVRDDVQYFRDLYNVDRVEALKGPNAMTFGRGGGGGVLNRVIKEAQWTPVREVTLNAGSFEKKRATLDMSDGLNTSIAGRVNALYENSDGFRHGVNLERYGINPTVTIVPDAARRTRIGLGYEYFADYRTADRGIPSFEGRPVVTDVATFFGDPAASWAEVDAHLVAATLDHRIEGGPTLRNRTSFASYDKFYQNVFPGAVNATGDEVAISAYNNATDRRNLFSQTDVTHRVRTGGAEHTLLAGIELGRQWTENFRNTGFFDGSETSVTAPVATPTVSAPITFRQSATDADNEVTTTVGSIFVQDQVALGERWELLAGVRLERFDIRYHDNRSATTLERRDDMVSPRAGLIFKPAVRVSVYGSYAVSHLPSSGDQFSSLNDVTKGLEPERFKNREVGVKWDISDRLAVTVAGYRLDRTNTRAPDPADPTRTVQTGSQRSTGVELDIRGHVTPAWSVAGAIARQSAKITSTTNAAPKGARVPLVPATTLSLWNRYQVLPRLALGLAVIHRTDMYAGIDNSVTLPGYTEMDAALYLALTRSVQLQANVENVFDVEYYVTAHSNNNISPGSPRALRISIVTSF
jgi:catecholate siderophore receptor